MIFQGGYKYAIRIFFIGLFSCLSLSFFTIQTNAQMTELTSNSTENLIIPGVDIESDASLNNANYRSRYGTYERALVKAVDQIGAQTETGAVLKFNYTIQIISGTHKNKTFTVREQESSEKIQPLPGDTIMVFMQPSGSETEPKIFFETYDRKNIYLASFALLIFILLFFFGLRGLQIITVLSLIVILGVYTTIPLYLRGWNIILITFLSITLLSTASSLILHGWRKTSLLTIIATVSGTMLSALLAIIAAKAMHMQISLDGAAAALLADHPTINSAHLILIGFILVSFAIIQDLSASIVNGMHELKKIKPEYGYKDLFRTGINIGREHAGTMSIILALAWIGSSISMVLYRYQIQTSWLYFLNQDAVANTLLLAIAGTSGIIASVPITSLISSISYAKIPQLETTESQPPATARRSNDL